MYNLIIDSSTLLNTARIKADKVYIVPTIGMGKQMGVVCNLWLFLRVT